MGPFQKVNDIITEWGDRKLTETKNAGAGMGIRHRKNSPSEKASLPAMKVAFKKKAGDIISAIIFKLNRSLFYTIAGAGNGQGGQKGSTWTTAKGERKKTDPDSLGSAGAAPRTAKPFLDVIPRDISELLDNVGIATMDAVFENAFKNKK